MCEEKVTDKPRRRYAGRESRKTIIWNSTTLARHRCADFPLLHRANHTHNQTFDIQFLLIEVDNNGQEIRILRDEKSLAAFQFQSLDGRIAFDMQAAGEAVAQARSAAMTCGELDYPAFGTVHDAVREDASSLACLDDEECERGFYCSDLTARGRIGSCVRLPEAGNVFISVKDADKPRVATIR